MKAFVVSLAVIGLLVLTGCVEEVATCDMQECENMSGCRGNLFQDCMCRNGECVCGGTVGEYCSTDCGAECTADADCGIGEYCSDCTCAENASFLECSADSDCEPWEYCTGANDCSLAEGKCESLSDCDADHACVDYSCVLEETEPVEPEGMASLETNKLIYMQGDNIKLFIENLESKQIYLRDYFWLAKCDESLNIYTAGNTKCAASDAGYTAYFENCQRFAGSCPPRRFMAGVNDTVTLYQFELAENTLMDGEFPPEGKYRVVASVDDKEYAYSNVFRVVSNTSDYVLLENYCEDEEDCLNQLGCFGICGTPCVNRYHYDADHYDSSECVNLRRVTTVIEKKVNECSCVANRCNATLTGGNCEYRIVIG